MCNTFLSQLFKDCPSPCTTKTNTCTMTIYDVLYYSICTWRYNFVLIIKLNIPFICIMRQIYNIRCLCILDMIWFHISYHKRLKLFYEQVSPDIGQQSNTAEDRMSATVNVVHIKMPVFICEFFFIENYART